MDLIDPATLAIASKALDAAVLRQVVHARNIASVNVDGFTPSRVNFEEQMQHVRDSLSRGELVSVADVQGVQASAEPAGNAKVEVDVEVAALSRNALHYQALIKAVDQQLSLMSMAVSDGKR